MSTLRAGRRKFRRFDGPLFVEFRMLTGQVPYSLGLTKNFSWEGLCFTFHGFSLEPGDRLEFKLVQPRTSFFISFLGDVIWKRHDDVKCITGIKFRDLDRKQKAKMLEIVSDSCNIPGKLWTDNKKEISARRIGTNKKSKSSLQKASDAGEKAPGAGRIKKGLLKLTLFVFTMATVSLMLPVTEDFDIDNSAYMSDFIKQVGYSGNSMSTYSREKQNTTIEEFIDPDLLRMNDGPAVPGIDELNIRAEEQDDASPGLSVENGENRKAAEYYIQAASYKDPEVAHAIFLQISEQYPGAYLFKENNFYKMRIPGIADYDQGVALMKEIKDKFNLSPILVQKTQ